MLHHIYAYMSRMRFAVEIDPENDPNDLCAVIDRFARGDLIFLHGIHSDPVYTIYSPDFCVKVIGNSISSFNYLKHLTFTYRRNMSLTTKFRSVRSCLELESCTGNQCIFSIANESSFSSAIILNATPS